MKKLYAWEKNLTNQTRDSFKYALGMIGAISTILTIFGVSIRDIPNVNLWWSIVLVAAAFIVAFGIFYYLLDIIFRNSIKLDIRKTQVTITCGDIFASTGLKVIGCDTRFDTRIDDIVISKSSLHGQLFLKYGDIKEIESTVKAEAERRNISKNEDGSYSFELGTIIRYYCSRNNETYLMLAATELNKQYEAHTNMAEFEQMLMVMWRELDRVYARNNINLPLLGSGISRFDDGPKDNKELLKCMLCTLNNSGVTFKSKVNVVLYRKPDDDNNDDIPLYEYKDMFKL